MWTLFAAAALAAPSHELLDDLDRWHAGADRLIDGPRGCWVVEGEARQVFVLHQAADRFSLPDDRTIEATGPFVGRIEDGVWTRFDYRRTFREGEETLTVDLIPLVGKRKGGDGKGSLSISLGGDGASVEGGVAQSMNLLREAVERLTGSVETRTARWDADAGAVEYLREVAVADGSNDVVQVTATFPDAGALATRIDAVWPRSSKFGSWPVRVTLRDPQMHVLGFVHDGEVLPNAESVSLVVGVLGFTVGYDQHLRYVAAAPCAE